MKWARKMAVSELASSRWMNGVAQQAVAARKGLPKGSLLQRIMTALRREALREYHRATSRVSSTHIGGKGANVGSSVKSQGNGTRLP